MVQLKKKEDMIKMTACIKCDSVKNVGASGVCRKCYMKQWSKEHQKEYKRRPYVITKQKRQRKTVCSTLKTHHHDMEDDPESLTTDFMQKMIGIKCSDD